MRAIKFRGKRLDNGEWVYGAFVPDATERTHGDMVTWGFIRRYNSECGRMETIAVDRESVGQYTGLKDKNGKEIYEGDVVGAFCDTQRFEIKYCEERGGYFLDSVVLCGGAEPAPECLGNLLDTVEVIGNIHENPELVVADNA